MMYLTYRDLPSDSEVKQGFTVQKVSEDSQILREGVLPGMFGMSDIHIRHLRFEVNHKPTMIICLTEEKLKPEKYLDVYLKAKEFLSNLNQP